MNSRIPFVAAVVGALLIGGATTGGTLASWKDTGKLTSTSVTSGTLDFNRSPVSDTMTVTVGGPAVDRVVTVTDASAGKNLARRISASLSTNAALTTGLYTVNAGGSCTSTPFTTPFTGSLGGQFKVCVRVQANSIPSPNPASLTLSLTGQQTGVSTGWSLTKTVPISVSVQNAVPAAPTLSCDPGRQNNNDFKFSWTAVAGATGYTVYLAGINADANYNPVSGMPTASTDLVVTGFTTGVDRFYRVKVTTAGGTSAYSNTIKVTRTGNGSDNFACGAP